MCAWLQKFGGQLLSVDGSFCHVDRQAVGGQYLPGGALRLSDQTKNEMLTTNLCAPELDRLVDGMFDRHL